MQVTHNKHFRHITVYKQASPVQQTRCSTAYKVRYTEQSVKHCTLNGTAYKQEGTEQHKSLLQCRVQHTHGTILNISKNIRDKASHWIRDWEHGMTAATGPSYQETTTTVSVAWDDNWYVDVLPRHLSHLLQSRCARLSGIVRLSLQTAINIVFSQLGLFTVVHIRLLKVCCPCDHWALECGFQELIYY